MTQTEKHIWLIDTIRRAGRISLEDISAKWQDCEDLSGGKPLLRCKFNRWRTAILIYDFIMALLGMGANVEIIKPTELREEIAVWVRNLAKKYDI